MLIKLERDVLIPPITTHIIHSFLLSAKYTLRFRGAEINFIKMATLSRKIPAEEDEMKCYHKCKESQTSKRN
jgi:hypothetical protein